MEWPSPRMEELHGAISSHPHLEAAFVQEPVVPATQKHQVRELRFAAIRPVMDMVRVAVPGSAAGEAASAIPELQSSPDRRWNGARLATDA